LVPHLACDLRAGTAMSLVGWRLYARGSTQIEEDAMRKLVAYELLSLDGVAEQPDEFITEFDEVMRENLGRVIATQDAVLLGRRT
jgi:dihydrofolate reductase